MKVVMRSSAVERTFVEDSAQTCIKAPCYNVELFREQGIVLTMACSQTELTLQHGV